MHVAIQLFEKYGELPLRLAKLLDQREAGGRETSGGGSVLLR